VGYVGSNFRLEIASTNLNYRIKFISIPSKEFVNLEIPIAS
jgi:hypothetical protein